MVKGRIRKWMGGWIGESGSVLEWRCWDKRWIGREDGRGNNRKDGQKRGNGRWKNIQKMGGKGGKGEWKGG